MKFGLPWIKFGAREIYIWIKAHLMNCINEFRTITCFYCNWYANIIIMTISCPWISKGSHAITIKRTIISSHLTTNYLHQDLVPKSKTKFDNNRASIVAISYTEFAIWHHKTVCVNKFIPKYVDSNKFYSKNKSYFNQCMNSLL